MKIRSRYYVLFIAVLTLWMATGCQSTVNDPQPVVTQPAPAQTVQRLVSETPNPTPPDFTCLQAGGDVQQTDIPLPDGEGSLNVKVYLPPCYDPAVSERYPVLYLLHGQDADNNQWLSLGLAEVMDQLVATGEVQPLLVVLPVENNTYLDPAKSAFPDDMVNAVIPYIDAHYRTCSSRNCRAIGGISRGGNWALEIGFSNPGLFAAVGAHSAPLFYGQSNRISKAVSGLASLAEAPELYVDVGDRDIYREDVAVLVSTLEKLGLPHLFTEFPGRHDAQYWSGHLVDYLDWYSDSLSLTAVAPLRTPTQ